MSEPAEPNDTNAPASEDNPDQPVAAAETIPPDDASHASDVEELHPTVPEPAEKEAVAKQKQEDDGKKKEKKKKKKKSGQKGRKGKKKKKKK